LGYASTIDGRKEKMTLIIRDQLVLPPTWFSSFRDLTLFSETFLKIEVIVETEDRDIYWRWLRPRGGMDFVRDFVPTGRENGIRLDVKHNYPLTVVTDRIAPENIHDLLRKIRYMRGIAA